MAIIRSDMDELIEDAFPERPRTVRDDVLQEARKITAADRNSSYGEPEDNFQNIADIWNAQGYRSGPALELLTATDVALMMAGLKLARLKHNPTHRDSWVDMAGYAACGYEVAQRVTGK